ncbi:MAG: Unknown protein [uncultured Sulfurovum sp.]|uniref:Uncharacterized protein n=1 Tax=uncultured Sulfurovum sp. TaxID=269237 RepID=A0A6S6SLC7_9BACT|nr:MAG: Unknown protein [uncultured Sulfurovum sp.]
MTKFDLVSIAKAGGSIVIDATKYTKFDLVAIASALQNNATLELNNAGTKTKFDLVAISNANPGAVTFNI